MVPYLISYQLVLLYGKKEIKEDVPLTELQLWDCLGYDICITEKQMLRATNVSICRQVKNGIKVGICLQLIMRIVRI